jgi:transposase
VRRADAVAVIGAALVLAAAGAGFRTVAARVGVAQGTVRGWLRRFRVRAEGQGS